MDTEEQKNMLVKVNKKKVFCDGGSLSLGHPRVYLNMGSNNEVVCPYCSKKFVYEG